MQLKCRNKERGNEGMTNIFINKAAIVMSSPPKESWNDYLMNIKQIEVGELSKIRKYRRLDRMSLLAIAAGQGNILGEVDRRKVGTIFNTSYGPVDTNLKFIKSYLEKGVVGVSPIQFSHTVNNAALGHFCQVYQHIGPSTMLLNSNYLAMSARMIKNGRVDSIFTCGLEPHSEILKRSFAQIDQQFLENASTMFLSTEQKSQSIRLVSYTEYYIGQHNYFTGLHREFSHLLFNFLGELCQCYDLQNNSLLSFISNNSIDAERQEEKDGLKEYFQESVEYVNTNLEIFEALGGNLGVVCNVGITQLLKSDKTNCCVIVADYDLSGNCNLFLLSKR
ncbi:hypothetical protein EWY11_06230 [Enterococcus faecalis]|nr:hypothetical protein [Enterococcus faecalis]